MELRRSLFAWTMGDPGHRQKRQDMHGSVILIYNRDRSVLRRKGNVVTMRHTIGLPVSETNREGNTLLNRRLDLLPCHGIRVVLKRQKSRRPPTEGCQPRDSRRAALQALSPWACKWTGD